MPPSTELFDYPKYVKYTVQGFCTRVLDKLKNTIKLHVTFLSSGNANLVLMSNCKLCTYVKQLKKSYNDLILKNSLWY